MLGNHDVGTAHHDKIDLLRIQAETAGNLGECVQRRVKQAAAGVGLVADAVDLRSVGVGAVEPLGIGIGAEVADQAVAALQRLLGPGDAERGVFRGHHAMQRCVAAVQALDGGAFGFLAELHGAARHGQDQPPAARQFPGREPEQHGCRRRCAEADEQAGGMKTQFDSLRGIGGCAHPPYRLVTGVNRRRQLPPVQAVVGGERKAGGDHGRAGMADGLVVGVVEFQAMGRGGVHECRQGRGQPHVRRHQRSVARTTVRRGPFVQAPSPGQQRTGVAAAQVVQDQVPDLPQVALRKRRVGHRQQFLGQRQAACVTGDGHERSSLGGRDASFPARNAAVAASSGAPLSGSITTP